MRCGILVVLIGIDGAGKSTVARSLVERERLRGGQAMLLLNPSGRRSLSTWCRTRGLRPNPGITDAVETAIRVARVLVSHHRAHRFPGLVVMDRHLHCQLALRGVRGLSRGRVLPWLIGRLPQPDAIVLLDLDPETAFERINQRGTDHESLDHLRAFRAAYHDLPESSGFVPVAAGGSTAQTTSAVERLLTDRTLPGAQAGVGGQRSG